MIKVSEKFFEKCTNQHQKEKKKFKWASDFVILMMKWNIRILTWQSNLFSNWFYKIFISNKQNNFLFIQETILFFCFFSWLVIWKLYCKQEIILFRFGLVRVLTKKNINLFLKKISIIHFIVYLFSFIQLNI